MTGKFHENIDLKRVERMEAIVDFLSEGNGLEWLEKKVQESKDMASLYEEPAEENVESD